MTELSIVIPALNEAGNIGRLIEETFYHVPRTLLLEVIVVDDGSTDETGAEIEALMGRFPSLRYLRHARPCGQSAAMRSGILAAAGVVIATMDGDGQNDPRDISKLVMRLAPHGRRGAALVGGVRTNRQADGPKRWASRAANWLRDALLKDHCPDSGCGIKVYNREAYLLIPFFHGQHRYLPALFLSYGHEVAYAPVHDRQRTAGNSKYTNIGRALIGVYDLIGVSWVRKRTVWPDVTERKGGSSQNLTLRGGFRKFQAR